LKFIRTIQSLNTPEFKEALKDDIQTSDPRQLPLQQGLSLSSYVGSSPFSAIILDIADVSDVLQVKTGIFYTGIIADCSCSDDPTPTDEQNEYCELQFTINKKTAATTVKLLDN